MQTLSNIALVIGWVVLAVIAVVIVALVWEWIGSQIWKCLPENWRESQFWEVPQPQYGSYITPGVSRGGLIVMCLLGGPARWPRVPNIIKANRRKRAIREASEQGAGEVVEEAA